MDSNEIYKLEIGMWEAARNRNPVDFLKFVSFPLDTIIISWYNKGVERKWKE